MRAVSQQGTLAAVSRFFHACRCILLLGWLAQSAIAVAQQPSFVNSYGLDVGVDRGRCVFFLTDTGMSAPEVTAKLIKDGYDKSRGLEVLLTEATPKRCGELGRRAALNAGFTAVRVRLATPNDRWVRP